MTQTAVEQLGIAFREWENFDKTGKDKPIPYYDFIKPFLKWNRKTNKNQLQG